MMKKICMFVLVFTMSKAFSAYSDDIPGYTLGQPGLEAAPVSLEELKLLQKTVLMTEQDIRYLRESKAILAPQINEILDVWYGFVGSNPHLLVYFSKGKQPDARYLARVRKRFGQWILDTADADFDQDWLNYQFEIGRRHHRIGKNKTDDAVAVDHIHFRYVVGLLYPITATLKPFLAKEGYSRETIEGMYQAWVKSVLLQTILWSYPYVKNGDF